MTTNLNPTTHTTTPDGQHIMVVFFSNVTNNTARAVAKLDIPNLKIPLMTKDAGKFLVDQEFVLIVPTYGDANFTNFVPRQVIHFLNNVQNRELLRGVIGTGNQNFGREYAVSGDIIAKKCGVPMLGSFEIAGTPEDIIEIREKLKLENFTHMQQGMMKHA